MAMEKKHYHNENVLREESHSSKIHTRFSGCQLISKKITTIQNYGNKLSRFSYKFSDFLSYENVLWCCDNPVDKVQK